MSLTFDNISHSYGHTRVLQDISFEAREGEILCLLGPSGGGKSTLLRLAAGLEPLQEGEILLDGELLARPGAEPPPEARPVGLVFQDHVLFPHLRVSENIGFGLPNLSSQDKRQRVTELLDRMDLTGLGERFPHELSGGQQQRVALARALAPNPRVLLLDEPFASVDSTLRRSLRQATRRALKAAGTTAIVVTHDPEEAMQLADSIAVMAAGRIAQHGTPEAIWQAPATLDVALLFGDAQSFPGRSNGEVIDCGFIQLPTAAPAGEVLIAVRPNDIHLSPPDATRPANVEVRDVRLLGDTWQVQLVTLSSDPLSLTAVIPERGSIVPGTQLHGNLDKESYFIF